MANLIKKILKALGLLGIARMVYRRIKLNQKIIDEKTSSIEQMIQVSLVNQYKILSSMNKYSKFLDIGFKAYSQFDEDGILLYIFSLIGFTNRKVVEICCGTGYECNTANLIINHSCQGLLFDGNAFNIKTANDFFRMNQMTALIPPLCKQAWITKDNINKLIQNENFLGNIDLLSLDIDGNDYWVWEAIDKINPRVFICETCNFAPNDKAITIPYKEDFICSSPENFCDDFRGASSLAMIKLSKKKGYRLVGAHKHGFNLIFIREDIGQKYFPEVRIEDVSNNPWTIESKKKRWDKVKNLPWLEV